jgi:pyruvate dehydrogenase E2 component (dihydrolipoamide acetyltransferase)
MYEVILPKMGETMETGTIEKWLKKEGDRVEKGDILYEMATDKVSLEVESYNSGFLRKIVKGEGEEVPIMEVVAYIGEKDEALPEDGIVKEEPKASETVQVPQEEQAQSFKQEERKSTLSEDGRVRISPLAKKMAADAGIDIAQVNGSGPEGRILKEDIEKMIQAPKEEERIKISPFARKTAKELGIDYAKFEIKGSGPQGRIIKDDIVTLANAQKEQPQKVVSYPDASIKVKSSTKLKGMRKVIAQRMLLAKQTTPHISLTAKANAEALIQIRQRLKDTVQSKYDVKITYSDFVIKIVAMALKEFEAVNASLQGEEYIIYDDINVGLAVSVEEGLIVPTIFHADRLGILDIARQRIALVGKAKEGKLSLEEISNATFTISNLGMYGIRSFTAIVNHPQAAILSVGAMYESVEAVNGKMQIMTSMEYTMNCDHRIIDGALAARFLQRIIELTESPELLII